jgi:kynureninase
MSTADISAALTDRTHAEALDRADPLGRLRDRFLIDDPELVYLDGNSLGRLPRATPERLARLVREEWGSELIRAWDHWLELPMQVGDLIGTQLLGAREGEVVVADSTTVNLYRAAVAGLDARPDRRVIVTDRDNFPTDRYVLEGLAAARGLEFRWIGADPIEGPQPADVAAVLDEHVALVTLTHVNYRSAAIADLPAITALAHGAGALTLWDLSHTTGSVPAELTAGGADLAVGCTYKYLNGGPGAPAFVYVRRELQPALRNPIWGWFGRRDQFAMAQGYDPAPGIRSWLVGTSPILALAAVEVGARLSAEARIERIRAKGIALTEYAVTLHDAWLAPLGFTLGSPRDAARRGAHVSVRRADARDLCAQLIARGVIPDFREPDSIRLGLAPLYTRFVDVHRGLDILRSLA